MGRASASFSRDGLALESKQWQPNYDAFGRFRTSEPITLFDSKQLYEPDALFWDDAQVSGSGTTSVHSSDTASSVMGVASATAGRRIRQTFNRFNYQSGKSHLIMMTGCLRLTGGGNGITSRIGYYDDSNGAFFQDKDGVLSVVVRTNTSGTPVEIVVTQSSWNTDKLDGTGASGYTINPAKIQLFVIDFEWLGAGSLRFGIFVGGQVVYIHRFDFANEVSVPYMSTPNLPLRAEIINSGAGQASTMRQVCSSVMSEAGQDRQSLRFSATTGGTHLNADAIGTRYALVGISPRSDRPGIIVNDFVISMLNKTNDNFEWSLVLNPTVAGSFTFSNYDSSSIRVAYGVTANTVTDGVVLGSGFSANSGFNGTPLGNLVRFGASISGTLDRIVLCATPLTAFADIVGSFSWRELR